MIQQQRNEARTAENSEVVPGMNRERLRLAEFLKEESLNSKQSEEAYLSLVRRRDEAEQEVRHAETEAERCRLLETKLKEEQASAEEQTQRVLDDTHDEFPLLQPGTVVQLVAINRRLAGTAKGRDCIEWFRRHVNAAYSTSPEGAAGLIAKLHESLSDGGVGGGGDGVEDEDELAAAVLDLQVTAEREEKMPKGWEKPLEHLGPELTIQLKQLSLRLPKGSREKLRVLMEKKTPGECQKILNTMGKMSDEALVGMVCGTATENSRPGPSE